MHLSGTKFGDDELAELATMLREFPPPYLDQRRNISLFLHSTAVTDLGIRSLKDVARITELDLGATRVTDQGIIDILSPMLLFLNLSETAVTDRLIDHFYLCPNLSSFTSRGTKITPEGLRKIHNYCQHFVRDLDF